MRIIKNSKLRYNDRVYGNRCIFKKPGAILAYNSPSRFFSVNKIKDVG